MDLAVEILNATEKLSTCGYTQVAAVLMNKDGRPLMTGYNGTPSGWKHCNDVEVYETYDDCPDIPHAVCIKHRVRKATKDENHLHRVYEVHAEQNIIAFCAKKGISTEGTILFTSLCPCSDCAKLIVQSGIEEVYYLNDYDYFDPIGKEILRKSGLTVVNLGEKIWDEEAEKVMQENKDLWEKLSEL